MSKPFPTLKRVMSAFKKAGAPLQLLPRGNGYFAVKGKNRVEFATQEGYPDRSVIVVSLMVTPDPKTDAMYDNFYDTFHDSIKAAVKSLDWS